MNNSIQLVGTWHIKFSPVFLELSGNIQYFRPITTNQKRDWYHCIIEQAASLYTNSTQGLHIVHRVPAFLEYEIIHMHNQAFSKQPINEFGSLPKPETNIFVSLLRALQSHFRRKVDAGHAAFKGIL